MILQLLSRLGHEIAPRILLKTAVNLCLKNVVNVWRFERRQRCGEPFFPGFMILSLTTRCNLACHGCWVGADTRHDMPLAMVENVIRDCMKNGSTYFGLVGGEPLLYPGLLTLIETFPGVYFQLFTNGTLLTDEVARKLARLGNVSPLISIEGLEAESDRRRGGTGVFTSALAAVENCRRHRLLTGVATSVCQTNFDQLVRAQFVDELVRRGVHYLWYYIYRPVGPRPHPEQALSAEQILALRRFIVAARSNHPIAVIDTYWDADGQAVCPGAMGLSHHLNPSGHLEFCPPLQFAFDRLLPGESFADKMRRSRSLEHLRHWIAESTRGCILLSDPRGLHDKLVELGAIDSSGRGTAWQELLAMPPQPCHHLPGQEIPETSPIYRLAKKFGFFGFSAYG
jgi:MoaA/NifB/PqqE/SkfB family radical SAM enzyme